MAGAIARSAARIRRVPLYSVDRTVILLLGDIAMLSLALEVSLRARFVGLNSALAESVGLQFGWWVVLGLTWLTVANIVRLYDLRMAASPAKSAATAGLCACVVCAAYLVIPIWSAPLTLSRLTWAAFVAMSVAGEMAWRSVYSRVLTHPRYSRKTIIVGNGEGASELASILQQQPSSAGREYLGLIELPSIGDTRTFTETEALQRLVCMADSGAVDDIVVAFGDNGRAAQPVLDALVACWRAGAEVIPLEEYYEIALSYVPVHLIGPNIFALLTPDSDMGRRLWQALRRAADVTVATIGLVCFAGVLPLLALAIWLDSPGPIFYRQQRVGLADRVFSIAKLRSMVSDAESSGGAQWATPNDRRVTRVGRWLRKSRLDELPQLWNVLVGDMSLIGPRPERPEFVARLTETLPYYDIRHAIRPGLTGWAQVRYRYGSSEADALIKLQYDLYYLKHRGPLLDALIALHTLRTIVRLEGQ